MNPSKKYPAIFVLQYRRASGLIPDTELKLAGK
jgi:hypothetical protein